MIYIPRWLGMAALTGALFSCKSSAPVSKAPTPPAAPVLVNIGNKSYSPDAFFQSYTKNRFSSDSTTALSASEYFDVFINTKLKVLAAEAAGRDTASEFREEIASYRDQLALPYLTDKDLIEELTHEAYDRLREEIHASHILVAVSEEASPADTLAAYRAAVAMRQRLTEGADFGEMAEKYSKDETARQNRGDLGYFTAFQMVYPFETAAYNTPVGQLSPPVRTRFGYHLIKVHDRRPSRGKLRVAHILIQANAKTPEAKKQEAEQRIREAYKRLQQGESWEKMVQVYSDDFQSRQAGGVLPVFGVGEMMPAFEEAAFALGQPGSYTTPIQTPYGWHIIRLVRKIPLETLEAMEPMLRQKVTTDSRGKRINRSVVNRLKSQYSIRENTDAWSELLELADSSLVRGQWSLPETFTGRVENPVLFTIEQSPATTREFLDYTRSHLTPRLPGSDPKQVLQSYYNDFLGRKLFDYEKANLETKYPEFRVLMNDIREGVLLSQVMEEQVWQRSLTDSTGQRRLYEQNKEQYTYPERALTRVIDARDTTILNWVLDQLAHPPYVLQLKGEELLFEEGQTQPTSQQTNSLYLLVATLKQNPDFIVEIAGYRTADEADSVSAARISHVVRYLNRQGIPITRITEKDYGSFRPVAESERNRRVSFQFFSPTVRDLERAVNLTHAPDAIRISEGYYARDHALFNEAAWKPGTQTLSRPDGRVMVLQVQKIEAPRLKTFSEARGTVINAYQKILEKQWLDSLRAKFPVKVNEQELEKLVR